MRVASAKTICNCLMLTLITCLHISSLIPFHSSTHFNVWELMDWAVVDRRDQPLFETINQNLSYCPLPTSCLSPSPLLRSLIAVWTWSKWHDGWWLLRLWLVFSTNAAYIVPLSLLIIAISKPGARWSRKHTKSGCCIDKVPTCGQTNNCDLWVEGWEQQWSED